MPPVVVAAPKQPRGVAPAPVRLREEDQQLLKEKEAAIAQVQPTGYRRQTPTCMDVSMDVNMDANMDVNMVNGQRTGGGGGTSSC